MNNLMIFDGKEVEIFDFNGDILFNPKHVAECLEIQDINSSLRNFNEKQIKKLKNSDLQDMHIRKLNNAGEKFLTESGVYKLIFKSRKVEAERFQDWIADEVLPSIRKTGRYQYKNISPELRAILMHDVKIQEMQKKVLEVKEDLQEFKDDIPLFTTECKEVVSAVRRIGTKALGGKGTRAYNNKSLRAKVYADIHKQLKREFDVNSYTAIKRKHLKNALDIVDKYNLTIALNEQIAMINNQVEFN